MQKLNGLCFFIISVSLFISHLVETTDLFFDEDLLQVNGGPIYTHNPEAVDTLHNYIRNFLKTGKKLGGNCVLEHQQKMLERREYYVVQLNQFKLPYNRTVMRKLLNESFVDVKKWPQYCQFHPFWQKPSDLHCDSASLKCCTFSVLNTSSAGGNQSESKVLLCNSPTTTLKPMIISASPPLPFTTSFSKSSTRRVYPTYAIRPGNNSMTTARFNEVTSPTPTIMTTEKPGTGTNTNESISDVLPLASTIIKNNSEIQTSEGQKPSNTNNTEFLYSTLKNASTLAENTTLELNLLSPTTFPTTTARTTTSSSLKEKTVQDIISNSLNSNNNCNSTDFRSSSSVATCSQFTLFFLTLSVYLRFLFST